MCDIIEINCRGRWHEVPLRGEFPFSSQHPVVTGSLWASPGWLQEAGNVLHKGLPFGMEFAGPALSLSLGRTCLCCLVSGFNQSFSCPDTWKVCCKNRVCSVPGVGSPVEMFARTQSSASPSPPCYQRAAPACWKILDAAQKILLQ